MTSPQQLKQQREELDKQIKELEEQEKLRDFQVINYKGKEYRIYKWENKSFKDFSCPEGFQWADFKEFSDLVNETKFSWEQNVWFYSTNLLKNNYWKLARACLYGDDSWYSVSDNLAGSSDYRRVVLKEKRNEM